MLKNYFSIAFRNFWRNKTFSLINIFGLSIGISAALVIYLIVQYDFSFDQFHKDEHRLFRVVSNFEFSGEIFRNSGVTVPMGNALRKELSGTELVIPFYMADSDAKLTVPAAGSNKENTVYKKQKNIVFLDAAYFKMIDYKWLVGSAAVSLQQPYQCVITESRAKQFFPGLTMTSIPGKEIYLNDSVRLSVSGIVEDIQQNTDFNFNLFIARATLENTRLKPGDWEQWDNTNSVSQLMIKLSPGTPVAAVEKGINSIFSNHHKKEPGDNSKTAYALQPLNDLHFNPDYDNFDQRQAHKPTLYGLLAVAAFLLLLGCINFINLTTAQASQRAKEIGIRKTLGSSKQQLVFQFLIETFLLTAVATLISITITPLLLKVFADFIPEGLHFNLTGQPGILLFLVTLVVMVTLLSGFYPAIVLSGFNPVLVLKNQSAASNGQSRNAFLRKTLTVSQFVIAQVFIIATILVSRQISYSLNKDLGFKKNAVVYFSVNFRDNVPGRKLVLLEKLKAVPGIEMISLSNSPPSSSNTWSSSMRYKDGKKEIDTDVQLKMIDTNFLSMYKMKLLAGGDMPYSDTGNTMIINETYAKILGFSNPQQAVGKYIEWNNKQMPIAGVAANFHQKSTHEIIKPLALVNNLKQCRTFNIALQPQNSQGTTWKTAIAGIEKNWKEVYPADDFDYHFLDESLAKYYTAEKNISSLLLWATGLAIAISCLGLLGLVIYITHQRTKEIGIRKVIGASIGQLVALLSKDFLKLVAAAFLIAVPIAWWGAYKWLQNFAYKTEISWWIFISGGLIMFAMAMLILGIRTFKAAAANPVDSLRTE